MVHPMSAPATRGGKAHVTTLMQRLDKIILGSERHQRIRLRQWLIACLATAGCALFFAGGVFLGWMSWENLLILGVIEAIGQGLIYAALRSGFSLRFADPALTEWQTVLAIVAVDYAYMSAGSARHLALCPLLLVFTFGAFSLPWQRIARLTIFALASFLVSIAVMEWQRAPAIGWSLDSPEMLDDISALGMLLIVLPVISYVASRLSRLRSNLREQRVALASALEQVQRLAAYDELTGLANRRHAQDRLAQEQARAERSGTIFSVALIDLDHFKEINDTLGHAGGDRVLRAFADTVRDLLRGSDMVARWGGEEFLVLMPDSAGGDALATVDRLLQGVRGLRAAEGQPFSFSAGVTQYRRGEGFMEAVARADQQMYAAKHAGRNGVCLA